MVPVELHAGEEVLRAQLAGTVIGAFGLGVISKLIEPFWGAVLAKIAVLVLIVLFIQKRPQGMFALKGRSAEV